MAAAKKLPSSDEVGLHYLEQLIRHGGKAKMRALAEPPKEEGAEEESKSGEVDLDDLEQLLKGA